MSNLPRESLEVRFSFLIETFLTKTQTQLGELRTAISDKNTDEIVSIVHGMKGSAGSVGASSMHQLCKDYEENAKNNNLSESETWIDTLQAEFERYKNDIQAYL